MITKNRDQTAYNDKYNSFVLTEWQKYASTANDNPPTSERLVFINRWYHYGGRWYYYGGSLQTCNEDKYCFLSAPWIISPTAVMLLEQFLNYSVMLLPMVSQAVMTSWKIKLSRYSYGFLESQHSQGIWLWFFGDVSWKKIIAFTHSC